MPFQFQKAARVAVKLKIGLQGPSGSGKTLGALALATSLAPGGTIALIDTENGSASLYADRYEFDTLSLGGPYTSARYAEAIDAAVAGGYDVIIVDSLSHQWVGEGGILARKEALDARGGNSYTNWASFSKEHEAFKAKLLNCPVHLIATVRAKQDYVIEQNERGKSMPKKVGMAPVQREGIEYEFSIVFELQMEHRAMVSKDRTGLFTDTTPIDLLDKSVGKRITTWLSTATVAPVPQVASVTGDDLARLALPGTKAHFNGWGGTRIIALPVDVLPMIREKLKLAGEDKYARELAAVERRLEDAGQAATPVEASA